MYIFRATACSIFTTLAITFAGDAHALTSETDSIIMLPDVAVTAVKRGFGNLATESSTTLKTSEIERLDITDIKDISDIAPNFYMPEYGSMMTSSIYVRGLGTRIDQPVMGMNIDNVPVQNKDNFDFTLDDIDKIELLRGAQNILYGRNTMGGLINIFTRSPLVDNGVRLRLSYGNRNRFHAGAGISGRIIPSLGMSLNINATGHDGYFRNEFNNTPVGRKRQYAARWKTAWKPSSDATLENTLSVNFAHQNGYPYAPAMTGIISYNDTCFYHRTSIADGLTANWMVSPLVTLSAIAGIQYLDDNLTLDQDFTPKDYFTLTQTRRETTASLDLLAKSRRNTSCYHWLAGLYGLLRHTRMNAPVTFYDYGLTHLIEDHANELSPLYPIRWDERNMLLDSRFTMPGGGFSIYHESALSLQNLTITASARFDWEQIRLRYQSLCNTSYSIYNLSTPTPSVYKPNILIDINDIGNLRDTYMQLLPKAAISYQLPHQTGSVFFSITKGYKPGGYNTQMFSDVLQQKLMGRLGLAEHYTVEDIVAYKPEKSINYEIGSHLSLFNDLLKADLTAFWIDLRDQQLTMFPPGSVTGRIMTNAGRSRSAGIEASVRVNLNKGFSVVANYGWCDARFHDFNNGKQDFKNNHIPYAPQHTLFIETTYSHRFSNSFIDSLLLSINARGTGRIYWDENNRLSQPFYVIAGAQATISHKTLSLQLWGKNLTATEYNTFYFQSIGNKFLQRGAPLSFGATLRYKFDL